MNVTNLPELKPYLEGADHIDVKTCESDSDLRGFLSGMMNYQPGWVTALYGVRAGFVRLLGMRQEGIPRPPEFTPENIPMSPGQSVSFFTVLAADPDRWWLVGIDDDHLNAALGVVAEPLSGGRSRFHVLTIVHHNNWKGHVYFNLIRPFHHLVVGGMVRAGAAASA